MIKKNTLTKNKKIFWFSLFLFSAFILPKTSLGVEGDIFWEQADDLTSGIESAYGIAVDSNYVYAVGGQEDMGLWRIEKRNINDGVVEWSVAEDFIPKAADVAMEVAVDSTAIYVGGSIDNWSKWRVEKRSLEGDFIVWAYEEDFTADKKDKIAAIEIDCSGVYIAGSENNEKVWRVEKRSLDNGNLIWDARITSGGYADGIVVDSTGVYAVGSQDNNLARVEKRKLADGTLIWEQTPDFGTGKDVFYGVGVDITGVYLAGSQNNNSIWRVEKRDLNNGEAIWEKQSDLDFGKDMALGIEVSTTGVYVSGCQNNGYIWRVEKRDLSYGNLEWEKKETFLKETTVAHQLAFYSDGLYVVGHKAGRKIWRVEKREKNLEIPTLSVSLSADPTKGNIPLNGVDLIADVRGAAGGSINYIFYCDRDDNGTDITPSWDAKYEDSSENPKKAVAVCDYALGGNYTAKVIVERGSLSAQDKIVINAVDPINTNPVAKISCSTANCAGFNSEPFFLINNSFDSDSTNAPDNDNQIASSKWFIDNNYVYSCNYAKGCNLTPNNYVGAGSHTAKLYVEDTLGGTSVTTQNFRIKKDIVVDFMCSADKVVWENCENFKITERETFFLKDVSVLSDGASAVSYRGWKKDRIPFDGDKIIPALVATQGNMIIRLETTDNAGRTGVKTHTVFGKIFKLRWKESSPQPE
jgi:hypothetical protein